MRLSLPFLSNKIFAAVAALVLVAAGGSYVLFSNSAKKSDVMELKRGLFLQQVSASGKVIAADDVALGFTGSGRLASLSVSVGDRVRAGQVLAALDSSDLAASVSQRQAALSVQEAKLAALQQGTRPEQIAVAQSTVESNVASVAQAKLSVLDSIKNAYTRSDDAVYNKIDAFISNAKSVNPQLVFMVSDTGLSTQMLNMRSQTGGMLAAWHLSEASDNISESDIFAKAQEAQSNLSSIRELLSLASATLNRAITTPGMTQATINGYLADVTTARTNIDAAVSSLTASVTALRSALSALETSQKNLALQQAGTTQADIDAQISQVRAAKADLENAQAQLSKTRIVAPFDGVITSLSAVQGQIVSPNVPIMRMIAPRSLQIESYVPEIQISLLHVGDPAMSEFDGLPGKQFTGRVVSIDPAETVRNGVSTYRTIVQFTDEKGEVKSGMTANILITTMQRENTLAIPQGLVIERDGKKYVRVREGDLTIEKEVVVGAVSSLGQVEILSGLSEGDRLVLE